MARPSISIPDEVVDEVDDRRHSTTPRSQWILEAILARLQAEDAGVWVPAEDYEIDGEQPAEA